MKKLINFIRNRRKTPMQRMEESLSKALKSHSYKDAAEIKIRLDPELLNFFQYKEGVNMELKDYETCELVDELKKREGVECHFIKPHASESIPVEGAAVALIVID